MYFLILVVVISVTCKDTDLDATHHHIVDMLITVVVELSVVNTG